MEARKCVSVTHSLSPQCSISRIQCGHLGGKVLVPTSTHISRLIASRFQLDLMKSTMLLIARTDSESGKLISSNVDIAEHEFIVGTTTKGTDSLAQVLAEAEIKGATGAEVDQLEKEWTQSHEMCTFNQGMELSDPQCMELN